MLQLIDTPFGPLAARWTLRGLFACEFVRPGLVDDDPPQRPLTGRKADARELNAALDDYFHSGRLEWDLNRLDWTGVTEFYQLVLRACYAIPSGQTQSYGQLAARVDRPRAARAVGTAMARNRWPIIIPCHRVVGSAGQLTGYSGRGGLDTKRELLNFESSEEGMSTKLFC